MITFTVTSVLLLTFVGAAAACEDQQRQLLVVVFFKNLEHHALEYQRITNDLPRQLNECLDAHGGGG